MPAKVVRVTVERRGLRGAALAALRELFHLERLPLAPARVEVEIEGVPTAVVNALRRTVLDEMPGRALQVPPDGFDTEATTEEFMLPQFVSGRIAFIPLRPQVPLETVRHLRLELDATNTGAVCRDVYAGDLTVVGGSMPEPLFNPTFKLATLQPGKRLVIRGIQIVTGYGRDFAAFNVTHRAAHRHLDVAQHPREATHLPGDPAEGAAPAAGARGSAVDLSGYTASCLVSNPRHHVVSAVVAATPPDPSEARSVFVDGCSNIIERLRLVATTVESDADAPAGRGATYAVVQLEGGLAEGVLQVPGETDTIGELLRRAVYEEDPEVSYVAYVVVDHENRLVLTVRHVEDVTRLLVAAVRQSIATFEEIRRGIGTAH